MRRSGIWNGERLNPGLRAAMHSAGSGEGCLRLLYEYVRNTGDNRDIFARLWGRDIYNMICKIKPWIRSLTIFPLSARKQQERHLSQTLDTEGIGSKGTIWISQLPCLLKPLVLGPVFVIVVPACIKIVTAIRTPEHTFVLLAEYAIRTKSFLVIDLFPVISSDCFSRLVEAVERADERRIPPAVSGAIVSVCHEFGVFATDTLKLGGQPAAVGLRLDDGVDTLSDPIGPTILGERTRIGRIGAFDVGVIEFANVAEDPLPC